MLPSRECSIRLPKVLRSPSLRCFASTGCVTPALTGPKTILARELVNTRTHSGSAAKRQPVYDP